MVELLREGEEKTTQRMPCHTHTRREVRVYVRSIKQVRIIAVDQGNLERVGTPI